MKQTETGGGGVTFSVHGAELDAELSERPSVGVLRGQPPVTRDLVSDVVGDVLHNHLVQEPAVDCNTGAKPQTLAEIKER